MSMTSRAPAARAILATWPFVKECPWREVISRKTPFSAASRASSAVMNPGCARMSGRDSMAARLVPGATGSTGLSPCTTTTTAPRVLASATNS